MVRTRQTADLQFFPRDRDGDRLAYLIGFMVDGIGQRLLDRDGRDVEGSYGFSSVFDLGHPLLDDGVADLADGIAQLSVKGTDNDRLRHPDPRWIGFVDDLDACVGDVRIGLCFVKPKTLV